MNSKPNRCLRNQIFTIVRGFSAFSKIKRRSRFMKSGLWVSVSPTYTSMEKKGKIELENVKHVMILMKTRVEETVYAE